MTDRPAFVLLEDGTWYPGTTPRPVDSAFGEVVFTTNLSGYQEVFTDPSYLGQIVVMTAPMIGNYGINPDDMESGKPQVTGVVVREMSRHASNWRSTRPLDDWLAESRIPVIENVDTRRLTRHIRERGAMRGVIAEGREPTPHLTLQLMDSPSMNGLDLASRATTPKAYQEGDGPLIVAYDYGMKRNIARMLSASGCRVSVVPATMTPKEVQKMKPAGLFLSNGPGDPAAVGYAIKNIKELAESGLPTFGICLGHQLLALALGGKTRKMAIGHRGANHPVKDLATGKVEITSQNHGFCVLPESLPKSAQVTHVSLFDGSNEGLKLTDKPVFSVQYHPEASPGPQDSHYLFERFVEMMARE